MLKEDARQAIIREWLSLPATERATQHQAHLFTIGAMQRYRFRAPGDPHQHIMGWLAAYTGRD
ncbi:MAG: hypothetical protein KJZ75_02335 [Hyphomonadaceae bacterium]|nr:hypothetical protein [Hyphomonadaceae bacterium]